MIVAIDSHNATDAGSKYGHVGIYIGGGKVMDNVGSIRTTSIDEWCQYYNEHNNGGGVKWGWVNGKALC
jgi:cell wall-associated NlpC family hydrolase